MAKRKIGTTEQLWLRMGELDSNNFCMVASLTGQIQEEKLTHALAEVVKAQVMLRAKILDLGKDRYLNIEKCFAPKIDIISRESETHWQEVVENELAKPVMIATFPLWRFTWMKGDGSHELIMTFNHALSDGRSGVRFYESLLHKMADENYVPPSNSLFAPYEKQLKKTDGVRGSLTKILKAALEYRKNSKKRWFSFKKEGTGEHRSKLISRTVPQYKIDDLLEECRSHGASVSTYIAAVMATSARKPGLNTGLSIATDLRPFLKGNHKMDVGYFVSTVDLICEPSFYGSQMKLAAGFKKRINRQLNRSQFKFDESIRWLALKTTKSKRDFEKLIQKAVNNCMLLTNLGQVDIQQNYKDFTLKRCFHVPAIHLMKLPFLCLATSSVGDHMIFNFTFDPGAFDEQEAMKTIDEIMRKIENVN